MQRYVAWSLGYQFPDLTAFFARLEELIVKVRESTGRCVCVCLVLYALACWALCVCTIRIHTPTTVRCTRSTKSIPSSTHPPPPPSTPTHPFF